MALNEKKKEASAPAWVASSYFAGLVLLFLGQRVVLEVGWLATALSVLAGVLLLGSTALRFAPQFRPAARSPNSGEHASVARLLSGLQALGLLGLLLYFASSEKGFALLGVEGDSKATVEAVLRVVWISCLSVSCAALLFAEVALHPMRGAAHLESRRVRAAAASGGILALAVSYGSLFVFAASETEAQADFSYFKTSEPGEATVKLMQKLSEPIKVTAFFPEVSEVRAEVKGYLTRLKARAGNLEFQLVDRYLQPKLAKELKVVTDGSIVLTRGESSETLRIGTEIDKVRSKLKTLDQDFNAELFKLLRTRRVAYLTVGHGELNDKDLGARREEGRSAEIFNEILKLQNYRVKELGLSQGLANEIPDDAGIVMVLGPIHPFAPEETATLQRYAEAGGKVLLALDSDAISSGDADGGSNAALAAHHNAAGSASPSGASPSGSATATPSAKPTASGKPATATTAATSAPSSANPTPAASAAPSANAAASATAGSASPPSGAEDWRKTLARALGAEFDPTPVADDTKFVPRSNNASDRLILFTNRFSSHASVSTLSRHSTQAAVILSGAGQLEPIEGGAAKGEVTLRTFASAFADADGNFARGDSETARTFNLGVAVTRPLGPEQAKKQQEDKAADKAEDGEKEDDKKADADVPDEMRAFIIADADVFSDLLMSRFRDNRVLVADAVRWLGGEESLMGEIENEEDVRVEQTKQTDVMWFYSTIFGVPVLVLGLGLFVSRRLRRGGAQ